MTSTQFMRIQPFISASQLPSSPHQQQRHHHHPSPSMRKLSLTSTSCTIDTLANAEALRGHTSPTSGHVSPESDDSEIIANGNPTSPGGSTIPIEYCSVMKMDRVEPDGVFRKGLPRTFSYDDNLFDIRRVPPEQIAAQITLLDLKKFKAIGTEELRRGNWNKKRKRELAPNIVAFTQQFNHLAFLVVREILSEENEKVRAEKMSQFIKIAKKLNDMNNLHSLKAVIGALQSVPIHRLALTWRHISKKDRTTFEKMEELLSDDSNWKMLRERMDAHELPGIPHLGLYLTDLCMLENVPTAWNKRESIINVICYYQNSTYPFEEEPHVKKYLTRVRYIEELLKFYEDDNYKISLQLEPPEPPSVPPAADATAISPTVTPTSVTPTSVVPPKLPSVSSLRSSKSYDELSTEEEGDDTESIFASGRRNSFSRRSLNTNSKGNISVSASKLKGTGQPWLLLKQKRSVPNLEQPGKEEKFSSSMDMKKLSSLGSSSSPSSSPFPRVSAASSPASSPYPPMKPRSSSDWAAEEMRSKDLKSDSRISSLSALESSSPATSSSSATHGCPPPRLASLHISSLPSASPTSSLSSTHSIPQRQTQLPPPPSPLLAARKRGHKKSQSLGSNVLSKLGVTKPLSSEPPRRFSPEPAPFMSLIDDSFISAGFPVTPTGSIGNASTSGGSSHGSIEDLTEEGLLCLKKEEEAVSPSRGDVIKAGILRKKDVRLKGTAVSVCNLDMLIITTLLKLLRYAREQIYTMNYYFTYGGMSGPLYIYVAYSPNNPKRYEVRAIPPVLTVYLLVPLSMWNVQKVRKRKKDCEKLGIFKLCMQLHGRLKQAKMDDCKNQQLVIVTRI